MNPDRADADEIKHILVDVPRLGAVLRIHVRRDGANWKVNPCPRHGGNDACNLRLASDGTLQLKCYGCDLAGDVLHLIAECMGLDVRRDFPAVLKQAAALAGVVLGAQQQQQSPPVTLKPERLTAPRTYPPQPEVLDVWNRADSVYDDVAARAGLDERVIDASHAVDRAVVRVLVGEAALPRWAGYGGRSWRDLDRRLIVPMYDDAGHLVTLHARRLTGADDGIPKGLSAAGYTHAGAVFADPLGKILLATGTTPPWWKSRSIIVTEGVPDFLTWATHFGDDESAPAVLGVISGSWCAALAARIPDGCKVIVRTHEDDAGIKYGLQIATSVAHRCEVLAPPAVVAAAEMKK